jgi:SEC-C motif
MIQRLKKLFTISSGNQRNVWLGRNDPCWCGSGKKYKKCHMAADEPIRQREQAVTCSVKG